MKLGSLKSSNNPDGELIVVSRNLKKAVKATSVASSLRAALENWKNSEPQLRKISAQLDAGTAAQAFDVNEKDLHSALPRTWLFADGSSFIYHIKLVRKSRNAALPETLTTVPLIYQGECGRFLDPLEDIPQVDFSHGTDFEGEVGVIVNFVPMGTTAEEAIKHIQLVVLINDVSLRGLIPEELGQGFGFFQSKPASALSPFAVTPDELGADWKEARLHLPLDIQYNGKFFGKANAGEMHFHFGQLIAHAARTRDLQAGSLIGSGTVSNENPEMGSSCLAEKRMIEQIKTGKIETPFMKIDDTIEISMKSASGENIFGRIFQKVKSAKK
ncbi:MAG: fumarylacetoacetate hydrolase family protein [Bdellovibrionota bacterium]